MPILNSTKSKFLVLIMIISVTIAPLSSSIEVTGDDEPIIDYSLTESLFLELDDTKLRALAPGECYENYVVLVTYRDIDYDHRYDEDQMQSFIDNDVAEYLEVATYGSVCLDTTIHYYTPLYDSDKFPCSDAEIEEGECTVKDYSRKGIVNEIHDDSVLGQDAKTADILSVVTNQNGHFGQAGVGNMGSNAQGNLWIPSYGLHDWKGTRYYCKDDPSAGHTGLVYDKDMNPVNNIDGGEISEIFPDQAQCKHGRNDFLALYAHELLHALGASGHGASNYRICHDIMGTFDCAATVQPSSWRRLDQGYFPESSVVTLEPDSSFQPIKIRPLNLNLKDEINGVPNDNQIQILKIPLSGEIDEFGNPDPKIYYLIEARPRVSLLDNGDETPMISQADNLTHCSNCWTKRTGLSSEGVVIYVVNDWLYNKPKMVDDTNKKAVSLEPLRVVDADDNTTTLADAAFQVGMSYDNGFTDLDGDGSVDCYYCFSIDIVGEENSSYLIEVNYQTPDMGSSAGPPDMYITPTAEYDGVSPTITADIWVDSLSNNYDVIDGDFGDADGDISTNVDAVYMWNKEGDKLSPDNSSGDPPTIGNWNWVFARIKNIGDSPVDANTLQVGAFWREPSTSETPANTYSYIEGGHWMNKGPLLFCPPKEVYVNGMFCEKIESGAEPHITYDGTKAMGHVPSKHKHLMQPKLMNPSLTINPNILFPGEEYIIGTAWYPLMKDFEFLDSSEDAEQFQWAHACIDIRIYPVPNEPTSGHVGEGNIGTFPEVDVDNVINNVEMKKFFPNNWAYENIGWFEVSKGSPYEQINGKFKVSNDQIFEGTIGFEFENLPDFFSIELSPQSITLAPNETATIDYAVSISPLWEIGSMESFQIYSYIDLNQSGDIHRYRQSGGLTIGIKSVETIEIQTDLNFDGVSINTEGTIVSQGYTLEGEDYSESIISLEYLGPNGISVMRPVSIEPGNSDCIAKFTPGSQIEVTYQGETSRPVTQTYTIDVNGDYPENFSLNEQGNWTITYDYTDREGNSHEWSESINVPGRPILAPVAEGYTKNCGIGQFSDIFMGTDEVPLNDGKWSVKAIFSGDMIHRSSVTEYFEIDVSGMPMVHPSIDVGDIFVLEGMLDSPTSEDSPLQVIYSSPTDIRYRHILDINDRENRYSDRIILDEEGVWVIDMSYTNQQGRLVEWQETINVRPVSNQDTEDLVVDIPQRGDIVVGTSVNLSGRISLDTESTDSLNILITSPTGISYSRPITIGNDRTFDDEMVFDEDGRWTVEYILTNEDGMTTYFAESIDVSSEQIEDEEEDEEEASSIPGFSLFLALTGIFLAIRFRDEQDV